ncbi:MAG: NAD-dependent epimerase/dehydratase family protein [Patescibacteria group bacterium]|nr:NAD-dependent epimerase/dehydratase family protein [Patescibacteria group bacterium]
MDYSQLKDKSVLVTGGAGFVGSHLTDRLLREGAKVIVIDDLSTGKLENFSSFRENPNFKFIEGDVCVYEELRDVFLMNPIDYVFHLAAVVGVKRVQENPLLPLRDIDGYKNILELSLIKGVKKIVFSSSSEAYGEPVTLPEKEDGVHNPRSRDTYALTKLIGENMFLGYNDKFNLPATALRFFNVYGPRQESSAYGFVTGVFIRQVLDGKSPTVYGDGMMTRDFIYIDDNIESQVRALLTEKTNGQVINIGMGRQTTILDLAEKIIKISGREDLQPVFVEGKRADIRYRCPDVTRMKELLDFLPQVGLDEGLRRTYEWYKSIYNNSAT